MYKYCKRRMSKNLLRHELHWRILFTVFHYPWCGFSLILILIVIGRKNNFTQISWDSNFPENLLPIGYEQGEKSQNIWNSGLVEIHIFLCVWLSYYTNKMIYLMYIHITPQTQLKNMHKRENNMQYIIAYFFPLLFML